MGITKISYVLVLPVLEACKTNEKRSAAVGLAPDALTLCDVDQLIAEVRGAVEMIFSARSQAGRPYR